jgi:hypothetical protein
MRITLIALLALAADQSVPLSLETTGISSAALSGTPTTNSIDMEAQVSGVARVTNQLALTLAVTPGSTTAVVVKCYESSNNSTWGQVGLCDSKAPTSSCAPDARQFTLADYTTVGTLKLITTRWSFKQRFAKCSAYGAGTGSVSITGSRSWQ